MIIERTLPVNVTLKPKTVKENKRKSDKLTGREQNHLILQEIKPEPVEIRAMS
jgi:hypothetical protein